MKVTNLNRLSKLIAKNTPDYVLGEHLTVGVDVGGSLGKVPCSEELARQIQGPGVSTPIPYWIRQKKPLLRGEVRYMILEPSAALALDC